MKEKINIAQLLKEEWLSEKKLARICRTRPKFLREAVIKEEVGKGSINLISVGDPKTKNFITDEKQLSDCLTAKEELFFHKLLYADIIRSLMPDFDLMPVSIGRGPGTGKTVVGLGYVVSGI